MERPFDLTMKFTLDTTYILPERPSTTAVRRPLWMYLPAAIDILYYSYEVNRTQPAVTHTRQAGPFAGGTHLLAGTSAMKHVPSANVTVTNTNMKQ